MLADLVRPYALSAAFYLFALAAQVSGYTSAPVAIVLAVAATLLLAIPAWEPTKEWWRLGRGWRGRPKLQWVLALIGSAGLLLFLWLSPKAPDLTSVGWAILFAASAASLAAFFVLMVQGDPAKTAGPGAASTRRAATAVHSTTFRHKIAHRSAQQKLISLGLSELMHQVFEGRTALQASKDMGQYAGSRIAVEGEVALAQPPMGNGPIIVLIREGGYAAECRFDPSEWASRLEQVRIGEILKVEGTIGPNVNAQMLELVECAVLTAAANSST